ncbi:DUF3616 domain-containing protein [Sandaracinobacteroides saxicola]|uniref:DUF3616 domain-containing protein n=1 Tax=Sandaracinobacteroides saxicola TaxID=2759707 RepID=A0A7G5IFT7_9SPHN|nr:DUF3616 domain-containing protein [Sandaracinobacteroides saxicola]QMW22229.1 DUF3616 domain-containing protein [Sandaracinobacteroides saxicola]
MPRKQPPPHSPWAAWPTPAKPVERVTLAFDAGDDDAVPDNASAGTRLDDTLFIAGDEHGVIDRLTFDGRNWGRHTVFHLADLLPLKDAEEEADLEGLAAAMIDGEPWLWLTGSHARTRPKPEKFAGETIDLDKLADLKDTRARCLIARIPLVRDALGWAPVAKDDERRAGMLKQTKHGNALMKALARNPLIAPFTEIPAKEGGVDIEGIAVAGNRVALGMRGPVVATHAVLIEATVEADEEGALHLEGAPCKRLLAMEGLGIRDLKRHGDDLLILAGPTTGLSGPVAIYRWTDWANDPPQDARKVRLHRPERLIDLPFGRGEDHPEGLALWGDDAILVICDSPSDTRLHEARKSLVADVFALPA